MATKTPNYNLNIVPASDTTTTVQKFRTDLAGDDPNSNMMIIDRELKKLADGQGGSGGQVTLPTDLVKWKEGAPIGNPDITVTPGAPQQVFAQPEAPTEPDALIWIDTDEDPTTIDLDGKIATAINTHNTDANAHGGLSGGGKHTGLANIVIGTSTAGWTAADCDYLCDGTDDSVKIQAAIDALPELGGKIAILSGTYNLNSALEVRLKNKPICIIGSPNNTIIQSNGFSFYGATEDYLVVLDSITFKSNVDLVSGMSILNVSAHLFNCTFVNVDVMFTHNSSNYKCDFICSNCSFICDAAFNYAAGLLYVGINSNSPVGSYRITNNSFTTSRIESNGVVLSADGPCSVSTNHVVSQFATGVRVMHGATAIGNVVKDCDIVVKDSVATGNCVKNGNLIVEGAQLVDEIDADEASASGNNVRNGLINACGNCSVFGNVISRDSDGWCIIVDKFSANSVIDLSPTIIGNRCIGGTGGIKLLSSWAANKNASHAIISNNFCRGQSTHAIQVLEYWSDCLITNNVSPDGKIDDLGTNNIKVNNIMVG